MPLACGRGFLDGIQQAMAHKGPVVIDFRVKYDENCYPMVPPGASLGETIDAPELDKVATR